MELRGRCFFVAFMWGLRWDIRVFDSDIIDPMFFLEKYLRKKGGPGLGRNPAEYEKKNK